MTSYTSTIDDQQERHYIGNLLYDDDPFSPPTNNQFEANAAQQLSVGSVLPSGGPLGPSPNQAFWPEPPPPYSPYSNRPPQWLSVNCQPVELFNSQLHNAYGQPPGFYSPPMYNRHNVGNHYVTSDGFQHRGSCYAAPYSAFNPSEPIRIDSSTHMVSEEYFKNEGILINSDGLASMSPMPASMMDTNACLPLAGKSYRDAASEKKRANSSASGASALSNLSSSGEQRAARWESQDMSSTFLRSSQANGSVHAGEGSKHGKEEVTKILPGQNAVKKTKSAPVRRTNENEFQKITRKKSKRIKTGKDEQVATDEDGLASNQALDASSRFDVLQSLNGQAQNNSSRAPSTASSNEAQKDQANSKMAKSGKLTNSSLAKLAVGDSVSEICDSVALSSKVTGLLQRAALKKGVFGLRRDSGDRSAFDTPRFASRKQRGGIKKRSNTAVDYLRCFAFAVLSLLKSAANWIVDLVVDISLQSKDVVIYVTSKSYQSFVYCCQRFWYLFLINARSSWIKFMNLRTCLLEKFIKRQTPKTLDWGLSENILLPTTGDEAIYRLLRYRGQDAYAVLGLRADCTDDEIKHYYKRQAFLVHPDKNFSEGAAEAFKILSKAFEAVNTPELRNRYDLTSVNSPVHKELEELWQRLHDKMEETKNSLPCDCGKRHRRIAMKNISPQQARYCKRCNMRHPAKHNDIWAESSFLGFWWTYYACLDGVIYNVTQWANCSSNNLKNLKADAHGIQYCMVSYACGTSSTKRDLSLKRAKKSHLQRYDIEDCDLSNEEYPYGVDDDFSYAASRGFNSLGNASQLASCRSFDRRLFNPDRPRRAGRKKKLH